MRNVRVRVLASGLAVPAIIAAVLFAQAAYAAQRGWGAPTTRANPDRATETLLWNVCCGDGADPSGGLLSDSTGALYGITSGSDYTDGTAFKLTPSGTGYAASLLWTFSATGQGGSVPSGDLISDAKGALYGTTQHGGSEAGGVVFRLDPHGSGYTEDVLYEFQVGTCPPYCPLNGPHAGLLAGKHGVLFGTTLNGGRYGLGGVFELMPQGTGYAQSVLWNFGNSGDGGYSYGNLIDDAKGALYGTTSIGGAYGNGTVFKLTPSGSNYTETVLWSFGGSRHDGDIPRSGLIADSSGALYGTTEFGGKQDDGTVFKLTPSKSGYTEVVLCTFDGTNGERPQASLVADASGNLYGTTQLGGTEHNGVLFKLTRQHGRYSESVLWNFGKKGDGSMPLGHPIADTSGALYGTTSQGGSKGAGTVFKVTP